MLKKLLIAVALLLSLATPALAQLAILLPPGEQQFTDGNGAPLAGGSVGFYIPSTLTPKTTWADPGQASSNTNPVPLDASGRAIIFGSGQYREIVKDALGNTIWDQLTYGQGPFPIYGGSAGGTGNAITVSAGNWVQQGGEQIAFRATANNTGATTLTIGSTVYSVLKNGPSGPVPLTGGEITLGNIIIGTFDTVTGDIIISSSQGFSGLGGQQTNIASATTTDLGMVTSHNANITGTTTITSFGSSAAATSPFYQISFASSLLLTYNATSLLLPGNANIQTQAGDQALTEYLGSGNWQIVQYQRQAVAPNTSAGIAGGYRGLVVTAASATTATITASGLTLFDSNGNPAYVGAVNVTNNNASVGANGLDTGTVAISTWYNLFDIYNPTTQTNASLLSLSATAPTLPSGYTFMLRVGALRNAASLGYWRTIQYGRRAQIQIGTNPTVTTVIVTGSAGNPSTPTWVSESIANFVPPTAAAIHVTASVGGSNSGTIVAPNNNYGGAGATTNSPPIGLNTGSTAISFNVSDWMLLEGTAIFYAGAAASSSLTMNGWEDNL